MASVTHGWIVKADFQQTVGRLCDCIYKQKSNEKVNDCLNSRGRLTKSGQENQSELS